MQGKGMYTVPFLWLACSSKLSWLLDHHSNIQSATCSIASMGWVHSNYYHTTEQLNSNSWVTDWRPSMIPYTPIVQLTRLVTNDLFQHCQTEDKTNLGVRAGSYFEYSWWPYMEHYRQLVSVWYVHSVPLQLFVDGRHVGNGEAIIALNESGKLRPMLERFEVQFSVKGSCYYPTHIHIVIYLRMPSVLTYVHMYFAHKNMDTHIHPTHLHMDTLCTMYIHVCFYMHTST